MCLFEPTTNIWMKIEPYYRQQKCSPMTLYSGNIRFMRIFAGVPWRGASNNSGAIENVDFQGFRTLRLRHRRKWGQHYCIVLFSPLSPFHWPQNTWPWIGPSHFTSNFQFSLLRTAFQRLDLYIYRRAIYRIFLLYDVNRRDVQKRTVKTVIRRMLRILERIADLS